MKHYATIYEKHTDNYIAKTYSHDTTEQTLELLHNKGIEAYAIVNKQKNTVKTWQSLGLGNKK